MTTSVEGGFGSHLMAAGFILNNQLTDFDYVPEVNGKPVANRIEGGKRPLSSMSPTMLLDDRGRLRLVVGSPGGTRIIGFVAQSIVGIVDWKLDVQQAVASPHFLAEDVVELEEGTAVAAHEAALEALGHNVAVTNLNSGLHAIAIEYPRRSRVLLGENHLPQGMTVTLIVGAIVTIGFSYLFAVDDGRIHALMTASLATLIALLLLLNYQLETPFAGVSAIEPTAMDLVRTEIDAGL